MEGTSYYVGFLRDPLSKTLTRFGMNPNQECSDTPTQRFDLREEFATLEDAIVAIVDVQVFKTRECSATYYCPFGVMDEHGQTIWRESVPPGATRKTWLALVQSGQGLYQIAEAIIRTHNNVNQPQEEAGMDISVNAQNVQQALHIPRESLIERLKERRDEEVKAREEATAAAKARRAALLEAVAKLSDDQVANIIQHHIGFGGDDLIKWVEEKLENNKFVSKELEPSPTETKLDRTIRVLEMAADKEIEVTPTDPIYPLL